MPQSFSRQQSLLHAYYSQLCPFDLIFEWLRPDSNNAAPLDHREFSMSMQKEDGKDIYRRWLSFGDPDSMKAEILRTKPIPHKFDIGAVYSKPVSAKDDIVFGDVPFYPTSREFVLDIDMNDYDEIRTCCEGKKLCTKCWKFLSLAAQLIDETLRQDFGFQEICWVFSGRRGIHCWVSDVEAKKMAGTTRSAVASYLIVIQGRLSHHMVPLKGRYGKRAVRILSSKWHSILRDQDFYFHPSKASTCLESLKSNLKLLAPKIPVDEIMREIKNEQGYWGSGLSCEFWDRLACKLKQDKQNENSIADDVLNTIIAHTLQPRLDINVSKVNNGELRGLNLNC
eukprot:Gregarina_sp_Poly_1__9414@NODE_58_length_17191_cov_34_446508_g49_i0_p7_GENE_NODE_58_length_17191_cov_34_446508_g49_i0NODE_58_length_17191_cov_34_446508_g49_i0_p7_ORF_typecomplete_len339_score50_25DNA_primase_S/PF01896_19/4_9e39_NODE_58_length_17191_cov_34_446508_g49_i084459461